ncbi:hypothetical protein KW796_00530 [Candidatus Parcubacteria bacterium]|nr:hypothetical protein [Candidatus Parcubacteria bacterium]
MSRNLFLIFGIAGLIIFSFLVVQKFGSKTYDNDGVGIRFRYPDEYSLEKGNIDGGFEIILTKDKPGGEAPPAIRVSFAKDRDLPSGIQGVLSGKPSVSYKTDGLYAGEAVSVLNRGYMITMSDEYITSDDQIRKDFQKILETVELY